MVSNEMYSNTSGLNAQVRFSSAFSRLGSETSFIGLKNLVLFFSQSTVFPEKVQFCNIQLCMVCVGGH